MRISPLAGIGYKMTKHKLCQFIEEECAMTHSHPSSIDAAKVYVLSIQDALQNKSKRQILKNALHNSTTYDVKNIIENSKKTPYPTINNKLVHNDDPEYMDYFGIALQNMYYEFIHNDDFYTSILHIVQRGGDTDTNACISGAFLGSFYGIQNIPDEWKDTVSNVTNHSRHVSYPLSNTSQLYQLAYYLYTLNIIQ
jgi:ADP-ribosylglycohydrolase